MGHFRQHSHYSIFVSICFLKENAAHSHCSVLNEYAMNTKGEGEVQVFSAKHWDRRNRADLVESASPSCAAQVVGPYQRWSPFHLTVLTSKSEDYITAPHHLHLVAQNNMSESPNRPLTSELITIDIELNQLTTINFSLLYNTFSKQTTISPKMQILSS